MNLKDLPDNMELTEFETEHTAYDLSPKENLLDYRLRWLSGTRCFCHDHYNQEFHLFGGKSLTLSCNVGSKLAFA